MGMEQRRRPTKAELLAAYGKAVPDVIARDLRVLFCGINPSLYSAAVGHHFARPGNRFWKTLHAAGISDRLLSPFEDRELLRYGCGLTNLVARASARADELTAQELIESRRQLEAKVRRYRPQVVAILGIQAYRMAFQQPRAALGEQRESIAQARLWILPNPSGLNAHYQLNDLAGVYRVMWLAATGVNGVQL